MKIIVYTDGSSRGNPGPGGYGIAMQAGKHYRELSQGFRKTTNNRMELLAIIVALETLKKEGMDVTVYSDSKYVIDAVVKKWVFGWERKGFAKKANPDLWKRFLKIYTKHDVKFEWVKGHAGNPMNERVDKLAVNAALGKDLIVDEGYEATIGGGMF